MSLVGTRPILQDELQKYELHHRARIAIKPGITGMWQVSGRSDITDFEEVVRLDNEMYVIARKNDKNKIEDNIPEEYKNVLHFYYYDTHPVLMKLKKKNKCRVDKLNFRSSHGIF